jgi:uncharacterized RDD family membrane protein YckC
MVYEALIAAAILVVATLLYQWILSRLGWLNNEQGWRVTGRSRSALQIYLALVLGAYFCWFWHRGQTLAMRAWRLRLLGKNGEPPGYGASACRYAAALILLGPTVVSLLWLREHPASVAAWLGLLPGTAALGFTRASAERSALYDRIASTRLMTER